MKTPLDKQSIKERTVQFYSCFSGIDIAKLEPGVHFICSPQRDQLLRGFNSKYTIFIFVKDDLTIVTFSPKHRDFMETLKKHRAEAIITELKRQYTLREMDLLLFDEERVTQFGPARILSLSDYPLYKEFFLTLHPNADPEGWLYEYFSEKAEKGLFSGVVKNGRLVCVCDAPDMPYMDGLIQHTGIVTLEEERRKGYAKSSAALSTHHLLENGICPQWECRMDNPASLNLAKEIGYREFGKAYILDEQE